MQHGHTLQALDQPLESLSGQGDLRHQEDRLLARCGYLSDRPHVDFRLSAAGYAVQQCRRESPPKLRLHSGQHGLLVGVQFERGLGGLLPVPGGLPQPHRPRVGADKPATLKTDNAVARRAAVLHQSLERQWLDALTAGLYQFVQGLPLPCAQ